MPKLFYTFGEANRHADYPIHVADSRDKLSGVKAAQPTLGDGIFESDTAQQIIDAQEHVGKGAPFVILWNIGNG